MRVWRITREAHLSLDGEGARLYGGRWNSEGVRVVYTSSTLSLAALEYLAHIDPEDVPSDLVAMGIDVPDDALQDRIDAADLPPDWRGTPEHPACIALGDNWAVSGAALVLRVPSALVPEEENVLLNPAHAHASRVRIIDARPFVFDPRLLH